MLLPHNIHNHESVCGYYNPGFGRCQGLTAGCSPILIGNTDTLRGGVSLDTAETRDGHDYRRLALMANAGTGWRNRRRTVLRAVVAE